MVPTQELVAHRDRLRGLPDRQRRHCCGMRCARSRSPLVNMRERFIGSSLRDEFQVSDLIRDKRTATADDVRTLLVHLWCQDEFNHYGRGLSDYYKRLMVQDSVLLLLCLYTAARPGALVPTDSDPGAMVYQVSCAAPSTSIILTIVRISSCTVSRLSQMIVLGCSAKSDSIK